MMLYATFFAFDFTSDLNPIAGLNNFCFCKFWNGCSGAGRNWSLAFYGYRSISLYGVAYENGVIFAFVAHASMTVMIIVIGIISMISLSFINRRNDISEVDLNQESTIKVE